MQANCGQEMLGTGYLSGIDRRSLMDRPTHDEIIVHILAGSQEALDITEITKRLNQKVEERGAYQPIDVVKRLQGMRQKVERLTDGRWRLKRSRREERAA